MSINTNFKRSMSMKSVRSNKSVKSMHSEGERILDFDELLISGCAKFNCPRRTVVTKYFHTDEFLKSMKQQHLSAKARRMSIARGFGNIASTPGSDKGANTEESDVKTATSVVDEDAVTVTAVYNSINKFYEILINNQKCVPRVLMQILGLITPCFTHLTKMSIKKSRIDGYTIFEMTKFIPLTTITEICLDGSPLSESNYALLLEKPCHLTSLSLCRCKIYDEDCKRIISKLHFLESAEATLTVLNLSSNHITDVGAKCIGEALRSNRHLRYLNLADNRIGDNGADRILHALIDFAMTYDEIVCKRQRYFDYLKAKHEIYLKYVQAWEVKSVEDLTTTKRRSFQKLLKTKRTKPNTARAEMIAKELAGQFIDPFSKYNTKVVDSYAHCIGNMVLCYLNLSYNDLSYITVEKLRSVLMYQCSHKKLGQTGLLKVVIDGNPMPFNCDALDHVGDILQKNVIQFSPKFMAERKKSRFGAGMPGTPGGGRISIVSDNIILRPPK